MDNLLITTVFSAIAMGMWGYARKRHSPVLLCSGVVLMALQFAIDQPLWLILASLACCAVPWFWRD